MSLQPEPPIISRLADTLKLLRNQIKTAVANAGIPSPIEVIIGYPTWTEGTKVWAQTDDPGYISVDALHDARFVTRYAPEWARVGSPAAAFSATSTPSSITFSSVSGVAVAGTNVHAFFYAGGNQYDAFYQSNANDTPNTVAIGVRNSILALSVPGVGASAVGNVTSITGAAFSVVNIGGAASAHKEVKRISRTVQVSIWVTSPWVRFAIQNAITSTIDAVDRRWLTLPDGGRVLIEQTGERFDEQSQESTNIYIAHLLFRIEYGVIQTATATQIEAISLTEILQNEANQQEFSQTILAS